MESLIVSNPPLIKEAWIWIRVCHRDAVDRPLPPARVAISTMMADQVDMYRSVPPPGQTIDVRVQPLPMEDYIPEEKEITWAVHRIRLNRSVGPSGMRAEHLFQWLIAATQDDIPDVTNWQKVVVIVQAASCDGTLDKEST